MPLFRVRFVGRSALRVEPQRSFAGPGYQLRVRDALTSYPGREDTHNGLIFTVDIDSQDAASAITAALGQANRVADQLALAHSCAIEDPMPLFCLRLQPEDGGLTLTQFIRDVPELDELRRSFDKATMDPVFRLIDAAAAAPGGNVLSRIDRALHYLRRSYLERDPIDRFEDLSNGLQALEPRLREKFGTPTTFNPKCLACKEPLTCSMCGSPATAQDNFSGVDQLVRAVLGRSSGEATALRKRRNDIVHATSTFADLLDDLPHLTNLATEALIAGVMELVGADLALRDHVSRPLLPIVDSPQLVVEVALHGASREIIERKGTYPAVRLTSLEVLRGNALSAEGVFGVSIAVNVVNWEGSWEATDAVLELPRDPSRSEASPGLQIRRAAPPGSN